MRDYAKRFPGAQLHHRIGADNAPKLAEWRESAELARNALSLAIPRPGRPGRRLSAPLSGPRGTLKGFPLGVSSSEIRARVKAGLSIEHVRASAVAEAIRNYRLYL